MDHLVIGPTVVFALQVKALPNPPSGVRLACEAICVMFPPQPEAVCVLRATQQFPKFLCLIDCILIYLDIS